MARPHSEKQAERNRPEKRYYTFAYQIHENREEYGKNEYGLDIHDSQVSQVLRNLSQNGPQRGPGKQGKEPVISLPYEKHRDSRGKNDGTHLRRCGSHLVDHHQPNMTGKEQPQDNRNRRCDKPRFGGNNIL